MVFKGFHFSNPASKHKERTAPKPKVAVGLESLFSQPIELPEPVLGKLAQQAKAGLEYFEAYNKNRLALAYGSFDPPMKSALFDVLYLLHTNSTDLSEVTYTTTELIDYKEREVQHTVDLYVAESPFGVEGIEKMPPEIQSEFDAHIEATFGSHALVPVGPEAPIRGVFSIGSVGTVGHKHLASDLDLQVLYRVLPVNLTASQMDNEAIKHRLSAVLKQLVSKIKKKNGVSSQKLAQDPDLARKIQGLARKRLADSYPYLCRQFISHEVDFATRLKEKPNPKVKGQLIQEVQKLFDASERLLTGSPRIELERALRHKIDLIQEYIASRYPSAEVWLFPMSEQDMQLGRFRSTLESKESSGSAYELILTYDTLMPGVFFAPVVPSHFLLDQKNNEPEAYKRVTDLMRFGLVDPVFGEIKGQIEDQGPTPNLTQQYLQSHHGAIYWEAFKASSGNLPKAMMNLLRYETLLYPKTCKTIIQLVKQPRYLDRLIEYLANQPKQDVGLGSSSPGEPFTSEKLQEIEEKFADLAYDSWWQRYKVLKVAYCDGVVGPIPGEERLDIGECLDLAFALHVRLSDVFPKAGKAHTPKMHREEVLLAFLESAFPEGTSKRRQLEGLFIGDTHVVTDFEAQMRRVFKRSINRIAAKLDQMGVADQMSDNEELQIWYHYYQQNFEPLPHVIQPTILQHLKVPRGRVIAGFEGNAGWFFKSFQKNTVRGFGQSDLLSHLPEETLLIDRVSFLKGLAHCIFNGYYGVLNKGTLKESYTSFELSATHMNLGDEADNDFGYVQPGQIEAVMHRIIKLFAPEKIDYRACLQEKERVKELYVFLNLQGCGKLSFLYRNNLGNVMIKELQLEEFHQNAKAYHELNIYKDVFASPLLHEAFSAFLAEHEVVLGDVKIEAWVNDNSFETSHPLSNQARKQADLINEFRASLLNHAYSPLEEGKNPTYHSLEALKEVVFCGALVAAIDGDVNKKEYRLCIETLKNSWQDKWGPLDETFTEILKRLKQFLSVKSLLTHNINLLASNIRYQLTLDQQTAMLALMKQMLASDSKNEANKDTLIQTFLSALEITEN